MLVPKTRLKHDRLIGKDTFVTFVSSKDMFVTFHQRLSRSKGKNS